MNLALGKAWSMAKSLLPLFWREWAHHPWRQAVAVLAVSLGVALAWSVHVINSSALEEFSAAVRSANGEPDALVRGPKSGLDEALLDSLTAHPAVQLASPVVELETYARAGADPAKRWPVRVVGVDALRIASVAPDLIPRPTAAEDARWAALNPSKVFANAAARERLRLQDGQRLLLQSGDVWLSLQLAGHVAAPGSALLVMDISGAQASFGYAGRLTRIDLRLQPGADATVLDALKALLPPGAEIQRPGAAEQKMSNLSRAYRVNLTVLASVALLVGSFLVYSVMALSVAQRAPQLALLGVLGLSRAQRRAWVLVEGFITGVLGSASGLLLGTALAQAALWALAGDLGGGVFGNASSPPRLQVQPIAALAFGALGVLAACVGAWVPALQAQALQPAQALKGLGATQSTLSTDASRSSCAPGLALCGLGLLLALLPPLGGIPLAAYASVAAWLFGGVALVPWAVAALLHPLRPPEGALPLLALQRAKVQRASATAAVAGVVASLALCVALTVMVSSFRQGVSRWLDQVLPADLYVRAAQTSALAEQVWFAPDVVARMAQHPGVQRVQLARARALNWNPQLPAVTLYARELTDPASDLPLLAKPLPAQPGELGVFVSEAMLALYGARQGETLNLPLAHGPQQENLILPVRVLGVWRDYARQFGSVVMALPDYRRVTGDERINELALWVKPGASLASVQQTLREATLEGAGLDFASAAELRSLSLKIFDRSFAVTRYLQVVAIAIGIVGVGASLSAQVLARRKEFGLLSHLGFTRGQVIRLVCAEVAAWLLAGAAVGLALGTIISVVLVHVVNPQSFHWTMELVWPAPQLLLLCVGVLAAGLATAAFAARRAAGTAAVLSVKEDW